MLLTKEVNITCSPSNKKHLENKGYEWIYNKIIKVKVEDLSMGSKVKIEVLCDYCFEENKETIILKQYNTYLRDNKNGIIHKDCCLDCVSKKQKESSILTYGVDNYSKLYCLQDKDIHIYDNLFLEKNVKPLVEVYRSEQELLPFICKIHNRIVNKSISRLKVINIICDECMNDFRSELLRTEEEIVFEEYQQNGLIVCEGEKYINFTTPLKCYCIDHPNIIQNINRHQANREYHGCDLCKKDMKIGQNNPNWKGGITPINTQIRNSDEYKQWRNEVFKRDNYTCQICGDNKGGNLQAHHKEGFSSNEELRFDIDNGVTLCELCHDFNKYGSFHYVYGAYNNTTRQLYEYIQRYNNGEFNELKEQNLN
jgi:hypothetical protein